MFRAKNPAISDGSGQGFIELDKILVYCLAIVLAAVVWGFWDANREFRSQTQIGASVVNAWSLFYDTNSDFQPLDNGQVFLRVKWAQPSPDQRVSAIHIKGNVTDGTQLVAVVNAPCRRAGSTWLAKDEWSFNGQINKDLICFLKIDKVLKSPTGDDPIRMSEADAGVANMKISYTADVLAVRKPMRYVSWLTEKSSQIYEIITSPFRRV